MSDKKHWLVQASSIKILWRVFIAVLGLTLLANIPVHLHEHFGIEGSFGFYAWYGFLTCLAMVVMAKLLGFVIKRDEDYYDH